MGRKGGHDLTHWSSFCLVETSVTLEESAPVVRFDHISHFQEFPACNFTLFLHQTPVNIFLKVNLATNMTKYVKSNV